MDAFLTWLTSNPIATVVVGIIITALCIMFLVAFFQGREVSFWPPKIGNQPRKSGTNQEETSSQSSKSSTNQPFLEDFPSTFQNEFNNAEEVWLVGVSLIHTIQHDYNMILEKLRKGHTFKVLVVDPTADVAIEPAIKRTLKPTTLSSKRDQIIETLRILCELRLKTSDKLQIRTIQYPLGYGANVLRPGKASGALYIKLYPYKLSVYKPIIELHESDGAWYHYYLKEIRALWDDGTEWTCTEDIKSIA